MVVVDTGPLLALADADSPHHAVLRAALENDPGAWVVPWAVLPEVDYMLSKYLGQQVQLEFLQDVSDGRWAVDWGRPEDMGRIIEMCGLYADLRLGLTDAAVMATAERLRADAIATLDLRDFGAVEIRGSPKLLPRDL
jgi:predicted nucleic acid-binding protein